MTRIAINGFGRIGRLTFRKLWEEGIKVVAINDLGDARTLAFLLEHDSAQRGFLRGKISYKNGELIVDGIAVKVCAEKDPAQLPWKDLKIDLVIESTGRFVDQESASAHIKAGSKKVVISAPAKGDLKTIVYNVNHTILTKDDVIISGASCTTNCLAPMVKALDEKFKIIKGNMTTIHAATNDQTLLDLAHPKGDLRRGRAAFSNIVPSSTGAAAAIGLVLPHLKGKLDGISLRVPTITGSIVDLAIEFEKTVTVEDINSAMKAAANDSFGYNDMEIVSSDIIGSSFGSIFDATLTKVLTADGKQLVKVFSWYDNEMSYVSQLVRTVEYFAKLA